MTALAKAAFFHGEIVRNVLAQDQVKPDFEYSGDNVWIDFIHRSTPEAEIYFVTNRKSNRQKHLPVPGKGRRPKSLGFCERKITGPVCSMRDNGRTQHSASFRCLSVGCS
jgi:hypothetical protein